MTEAIEHVYDVLGSKIENEVEAGKRYFLKLEKNNCGQCLMLGMAIAEYVEDEKSIKVISANIDDPAFTGPTGNRDLFDAVLADDIRAFPTLLLMEGETVISRHTGVLTEDDLHDIAKGDN